MHVSAAERLQHLGLQHDAAPAAVEVLRRALIDVDIPSDRAQQQPGEETAERSADHDRLLGCARLVVHRSPLSYLCCSLRACSPRQRSGNRPGARAAPALSATSLLIASDRSIGAMPQLVQGRIRPRPDQSGSSRGPGRSLRTAAIPLRGSPSSRYSGLCPLPHN